MTQRILIVDDTETDIKIMKLNLSRAGYNDVITAMGGEEGFKKAQEVNPDLIILDINMPQMDGIAVHDAIREHTKIQKIPIIFVTSLMLPHEGPDSGLSQLFSKSAFDPILRKIKQIIG